MITIDYVRVIIDDHSSFGGDVDTYPAPTHPPAPEVERTETGAIALPAAGQTGRRAP